MVRRATQADAPALQELFAVRSRTDESTGSDSRGPDLDNPQRKLWLALAGARAIGMTSVLERQLGSGTRQLRVAYWTGLFVDPGHRSDFVYPQLMLAMLKGLRGENIHQLYAAVRRRQVAEAHVKMGFRKIGDISVLARPLQPALLLARYRGWLRPDGSPRALRALCQLPDLLVRSLARLQSRSADATSSRLAWRHADVEPVAALHRASRDGSVSQDWSTEALLKRYGAAAAGYELLAMRRDGRLVAAVIMRAVQRPDGIRAAVIMDIACQPQDDSALKLAFAAAENFALDQYCDVILFLDGLSATASSCARRRGYLVSPEKYALLLWTDRGADAGLLPSEVRGWRFVFGDHDTF